MTDYFDRNLRNFDIVPSDKLANINCIVVGVGAIGRQVAIQLTAMGVTSLELVDFDIVESVNLGPQGYYESDLNTPKVIATATVCQQLNNSVALKVCQSPFEEASIDVKNAAVFCCVDSIKARNNIWKMSKRKKQFWVDGRMLGEVIRVLTSAGEHDTYYQSTLFAEKEAVRGRCTAKATIYTSNVIAGMMLSQFTRWLRGDYFHEDILLNLSTMDMDFPATAPVFA
ncbi:MAG: ThiF family adenylyltransferase [Candidatus Bathyarchaeia archaeon]|jgi:sulfur carrier protein ThiS adenylyltransferase